MTIDPTTSVPPRWLHWLAVLTVLFTLPLLFLGAGVTSHDAGMVDPRGFRAPWVILKGLSEDNGLGWRLEYGHRTFGFLVGLCGIGLAIGCFFFDRRPGMAWLGFVALGLISAQGLLGIFRVDYNALHGRTFALVHGCFAQIVFATLVSLALFTSKRWEAAVRSLDDIAPGLRRWSIITAMLVFVQLVLGGLIRHKESLLGPRGHLLGAFVVVGAVVWLLILTRSASEDHPSLTRRTNRFAVERVLLMALLAVQLLLGIESWLIRFFAEQADFPQLQPLPMHGEWIRTAHYLVGTLLFSTTLVVALIANRKALAVTAPVLLHPQQLEGAI